MNKKFLAMAALALITTGAQAKVKLPHILGDNMILQQNTEASLWGWDKPGTTVEVTTSWSGQKYSAKTGKDGKWAIKVQTPKASYTPLSITFDDGEKTTLNNVLALLLLRQKAGAGRPHHRRPQRLHLQRMYRALLVHPAR